MVDVRRHVPRIVLTWDDEVPGARWRTLEGTLMFADISGFTALTEKLSKRGRIGAEEIVETLNRVFGGMLDSAFARGGDLLKFGGDALLLLFRGEGHAERACDAVVEMKAALREAASVRTSVGRLQLNMSVGIHSGEVHLFLVGQPTRELVVLGPGATATADAEKAANAGEVIVSPGTAERLASGSTRLRDDGALLLRRRLPRRTADGAEPLPEADATRVRSVFPHALGDYLDPGPPEPEHKLATIGFVRVSGTDGLLAEQGPDAVAAAMEAVVTKLEECLIAESVTLLSTDLGSDGAGFFLGSGVPQSSEDDEGRMLRALRRLVDADLPLPVQAGCNRGHVFVAEVGATSRAAFSAMGDTTNTAARIMSKATPGLLYAHPAVLEHSRTLFATETAGPFAMKGKAVPLLVYDVGEESGTRETSDEGRLPLLGREPQLRTLVDFLTRALGGAGGAITVSGSTGMGKSRLVHEALADIDGATVITVRAEPYGAASSYRVFRDPLRRLLGLERADPVTMGQQMLETLSSAVPDLLPMAPLIADVAQVDVPATPETVAIDPQYRPDRLADVLVDLVGRMLPGRLVLIAEEAHWADMASVLLLERIAGATANREWAVISVRRGAEGGFLPSGDTIELLPLPDDVMERLVIEATEAAPLRPHEVEAIVKRAEGNPLFVEEVTRVARTGGMATMPESLQAALATQIDVLDPVERRVLRTAAVLGRSFRRQVLRDTLTLDGLTNDPGTIGQLSEFLEADGRDRLRFRNSLIRDAAYEGLAYKTRARIHRAAGVALERLSTDLDVDASTLALHFSRAGDEARTWAYAVRAGEVARRTYANADAAEQYELALTAARRLSLPADELVTAWSTLGELRALAGQFDDAVHAYRRAAELCVDDDVRRAELMVRRARAHERAGAHRTALRVVGQARRPLEPLTGADVERVLAQLDAVTAFIRLGQEQPSQARTWAIAAAERARRVDDAETLVEALIFVDHAELYTGRPVEGEHTREALEICMGHGFRPRESIARTNLGNFAFFAGRWDEAIDWYQSSRRVALEAGNAFGAAETDVNTGELLLNLGHADEAEPILRDAVRVLTVSGVEFGAAFGRMQLARVDLARGRLAEAEALITAVVEEFRVLGARVTALEASLVHAEVANAAGRYEEALGIVAEAETLARGDDAPMRARTCLVRASALLQLGRLDEGAEILELGLHAAQEQGLLFEEARLLRARGELALMRRGEGDLQAAESDRDAATRLMTQLGAEA